MLRFIIHATKSHLSGNVQTITKTGCSSYPNVVKASRVSLIDRWWKKGETNWKQKSVSVEYMWKPTKIGRCRRHENQPQLEGERGAGETVQGTYIELVQKAYLNQNKLTDAVVKVTVCREARQEVRMVNRAEKLSDFYAFLSGWFFSKHE